MALCLGASGTMLPTGAEAQRLRLDGLGQLDIPEVFRVAGGAATPDHGLVIWSIDSPFVYLISRQRSRKVNTPQVYRPLAARVDSSGTVELAWDQPVLQIGRVVDGRVAAIAVDGERPMLTVETAVGLAGGWLFGGRGAGGSYGFALVDDAGRTASSIALPPSEGERPQTFLLSASPSAVFATGVQPPFRLLRVGRILADRVVLTCDTIGPGLPDSLWSPGTVSLPAVPLDSGFIQTLADQRADGRVIVLLDPAGRFLHASRVPVPMGFFVSDVGRHRLFAELRVGGSQVQQYRWSWRSPHSRE